MFSNIESSRDWASVEPLNKGWSSDVKYVIRTVSGGRLLLRTADIAQYKDKQKEFGIIEKYSKIGFPMSMPLEFGVCNGGKNVYMLLSWVDGCDLEEALPRLSEAEQYRLGREAGAILRKIHSVPLEEDDIPRKTKKEKNCCNFPAMRRRLSGFRTTSPRSAMSGKTSTGSGSSRRSISTGIFTRET